MLMRYLTLLLGCALFACGSGTSSSLPMDDVAAADPAGTTVGTRFVPPSGAVRANATAGSFAEYLRTLPLKPDGAPVHLFDGRMKGRQDLHAAVIDLSVGDKDLQQCADAVMRLRAEHLFAAGKGDAVAFNFTSGFRAEWKRWKAGERIVVKGNACSWVKSAGPDASHAQLLKYLTTVFTYAGTLSLEKELADASEGPLQPGDVFIQGGSPGHAVIVVDVARTADGRTLFLLAQSYMPAQEIHILRNPGDPAGGAWYEWQAGTELRTPEWTFAWSDRKSWP